MNSLRKRCRALPITMLGIVAVFGCSGGQDVTPESIAAAKALWTRAGIRDYELELKWSTSGMNTAHYLVTVRDGTVSKFESIPPDGRRVALLPSAGRYYSVDGLFLTIANELAQMQTERPFTQPKGTKVVMQFKTDPKLGYPLWYRRDVMGVSQGARIDVLRLTPTAPARAPLEASH
jgi:hypothetical protein